MYQTKYILLLLKFYFILILSNHYFKSIKQKIKYGDEDDEVIWTKANVTKKIDYNLLF